MVAKVWPRANHESESKQAGRQQSLVHGGRLLRKHAPDAARCFAAADGSAPLATGRAPFSGSSGSASCPVAARCAPSCGVPLAGRCGAEGASSGPPRAPPSRPACRRSSAAKSRGEWGCAHGAAVCFWPAAVGCGAFQTRCSWGDEHRVRARALAPAQHPPAGRVPAADNLKLVSRRRHPRRALSRAAFAVRQITGLLGAASRPVQGDCGRHYAYEWPQGCASAREASLTRV